MSDETRISSKYNVMNNLVPEARQAYEELLSRTPETKVEARLEPMVTAMDILGNPHHSCPVIHITGTNGKTSTARMIEAGLRASGLHTGLFTSPHLTKFTERISIDGSPVDDTTFVRVWEEVRPYLDIVDTQLGQKGYSPLTFFEALTVVAFAIFADAPVDALVLEVGLGGITDATNVAQAAVAVLTPISLDHTDLLGASVADIAEEKAGIIKPGSYVVSAQQEDDAAEVIARKAYKSDNQIAWEGHDFGVQKRHVAVGGQVLELQGLAGNYHDVLLPLHGMYQAQNLAVAIAALEAFIGGGQKALGEEVVAGMAHNITSPGRLEVIGTQPTVIVDAAHNPSGVQATAAAAIEAFNFSGILIIGVLEGKDSRGIIQTFHDILGDRITAWCFTQSTSSRSVPARSLAEDAVGWGIPEQRVHVEPELSEALQWSITEVKAGQTDTGGQLHAVLAAGSVTVAAQARLALGIADSRQVPDLQDFTVRDELETPQVSGHTAALFGLPPQSAADAGEEQKEE